MGRVGTYKETHKLLVKVLVETGIVGLVMFLWLLLKAWWLGLTCRGSSRVGTSWGNAQ